MSKESEFTLGLMALTFWLIPRPISRAVILAFSRTSNPFLDMETRLSFLISVYINKFTQGALPQWGAQQ